MKRSEVVKHLTNEYHRSQRGGMSEMSDEERMSFILNSLEEIGMLPPATLKNIGHPGTLNGVKGVMYVNRMVHEWDDEDPEPNYGGEP